ncbi:MAG: peroxiredoxin [Phycisphaerae bacterium]|jgi:peroxiredoxin
MRHDVTARAAPLAARPLWPLLLAAAGTLLAAPLYVLLLDVPLIRSTGWPMFLLAGAGAVAGAIYARRDDRAWVRLGGTANIVVLGVAAAWFFWQAALPAPAPHASTLAEAPDFTLLDQDGQPVTLSALYGGGPVLLVFYRGSWCPFCVSELRGLSRSYDELQTAGVRVVAVSVDPPQHSQQAVERLGLRFPILSDSERSVIHKYGVVHRGGGPGGEDIAIPAHFLIDRHGRIVWRRIAGRIQDRPDPREIVRIAQTGFAELTAHSSQTGDAR